MDPLFSVAPPPGDSLQQCPQGSASESPIEWFGHPFEKLLEVSDAISDSLQIAKVVWRQGLSLQDGEVDFNLIADLLTYPPQECPLFASNSLPDGKVKA